MSQGWMVSADDHLVEPADLWQSRLPAKLKDRGPKAVDTPEGIVWSFDGVDKPFAGFNAAAGMPNGQDLSLILHWDDMRRGCFDPVERLKDMDADRVIATICFPSSVPGFGGTVFNTLDDKELAFACIQAYNDFQTEEWAAADPRRIYSMILVPYWDPRLAAEEMNRCAGHGARAVAFTENPHAQGYPTIHDRDRYWDPVFSTAQETQMPLCMHIGSSSTMRAGGPDTPPMVSFGWNFTNAVTATIDWLLSDNFERFPDLKIVLSEGYIGWIQFAKEHCDREWRTHGIWTHHPLPQLPSEYFSDHVYGTFIEDPVGAKLIRDIGVGNVMVESDYPHPDGLWPNTLKVALDQISHLSESEQQRVLAGNAADLFRMDLPDLP